jgi:hypothetical protein
MKNRRGFIQKLGGIAALLAIPAARHPAAATVPAGKQTFSEGIGGGFVHTVFFWLVDETMSTRGKFVTEVLKYTGEIEVIRTRHMGRPAGTERDVVDNSYSYCLIVTFDSKEDHDIYQEHLAHQQFIENASDLWTRVQVYDSVRCEA